MNLYAIAFDWTINLGTVLSIFTMLSLAVSAYYGLKNRIVIFENLLKAHAEMLVGHAGRLDKHEERIFDLVAGLQRLVGQSDVFRKQPRDE